MPTENRSSNTEMVSDKLPPCADDVFKNGVSACLVGDVPKHAAETICQSLSAVTGWKIDWHYFGGRTHIKALAPAPQHQGDPVAVLYANGTVLTKTDCGDVFDICCKVETPLYTHADPGEVERLRKALKLAGRWCDSALNAAQRVDDGSESLGDIACLLRHQAKDIEATLSASAEPSAAPTQSGRCLDGGDCGIGGTCKWCPHSTVSPAQQPS